MKKVVCLVCWMIVVGWLGAQQLDNWPETISYEGRFRVQAPDILHEAIDSADTELGRLAFHRHFFQPPDPQSAANLFYQVMWIDYPEAIPLADSVDLLRDFFDTTIEEAAESVKGEVVYQADQLWKGYPGRVWRISYLDGQAVIKSRAFLVGHRFYLLSTISLREKALNPDSDRFFNSFRLLSDD